MFTLRFQTPTGHHWYRSGLTRVDVEQMGAVALRHNAVDIAVTNPYGTDVTDSFTVFRTI